MCGHLADRTSAEARMSMVELLQVRHFLPWLALATALTIIAAANPQLRSELQRSADCWSAQASSIEYLNRTR